METSGTQHTAIDGNRDYQHALDTLCGLAQHTLCCFDQNFDGSGFDSLTRYETLRHFLLSSPNNRLYLLAHDSHYLATRCARITLLLGQFGHNMAIRQTPQTLRHLTEPFSVADATHCLRRFHFDTPRGQLATHDPAQAGAWHARFMEMWAESHSTLAATRLGL